MKDQNGANPPNIKKPDNAVVSILKTVIWVMTAIILFSPFIVDNSCFFPFVGPKSLYFIAFAQILFFAWAILAIIDPDYRPKKNVVVWAVLAYLVVFAVSTFTGVDPSRSFWSKFERMGGLLMHIHLFLYLLALASFFKTKDDWKKIFSISVISGLIMGSFFLLANNKAWTESILGRIAGMNWGGMTIGNSSFLATYLLFNLFIAIYLLIESYKDFNAKKRVFDFNTVLGNGKTLFKAIGIVAFLTALIYFVQLSTINTFLFVLFLAIALIILILSEPIFYSLATAVLFGALFFSGGRAALYSFYGGMGLVFLFWMSFKLKNNIWNWVGKILLVLFVIGSLIFVSLIAKEGTMPYNKFFQSGGAARLIIWQGVWPKIMEKPVLGWGPETFELVYYKNFDPRLFLKEYGQEVWFDRAHNIFIDTLVSTGFLGLITYLGMFAALSYAFFKIFKERKDDGFWEFAIFSALLAAYFIQNLTVFDMITSFMISFFVIAYAASMSSSETKYAAPKEMGFGSVMLIAVLVLMFLFSFRLFFSIPFQADKDFVNNLAYMNEDSRFLKIAAQNKLDSKKIEEGISKNSENRIVLYTSILDAQMGKYQHIDFWADPLIEKLWSKEIPPAAKAGIRKEVEFIIDQTKTIYEGSAYNCTNQKDQPLNDGCIKDYRLAIKIAYLLDAYAANYGDPAKFFEAETYYKEALQLSPRNPRTYWSFAQNQYYQNKPEYAFQLTQKAIEIEPRILSSYNIAINLASIMGNEQALKNVALQGYQASINEVEKNPDEFSNYTSAIFFANKAKDQAKIDEAIKKALVHNPDWEDDLRRTLSGQ